MKKILLALVAGVLLLAPVSASTRVVAPVVPRVAPVIAPRPPVVVPRVAPAPQRTVPMPTITRPAPKPVERSASAGPSTPAVTS